MGAEESYKCKNNQNLMVQNILMRHTLHHNQRRTGAQVVLWCYQSILSSYLAIPSKRQFD